MTLSFRVLGVDPGKSGALALLIERKLVDVVDMPDLDASIAAQVGLWLPLEVAVVEQVHAMPRQGVTSSFNFGRSLGVIVGILAAFEVPVKWAPPATWKRGLGLKADKTSSRRRAAELWPHMASSFTRIKDDGRAEAALIAHWALDSRSIDTPSRSRRTPVGMVPLRTAHKSNDIAVQGGLL